MAGMTPAEAADWIERTIEPRSAGSARTGVAGAADGAIRVLIDHARAPAPPASGDLAALAGVAQTVVDNLTPVTDVDALCAEAMEVNAEMLRPAVRALAAHRCPPAAPEIVTGGQASHLPAGSLFVPAEDCDHGDDGAIVVRAPFAYCAAGQRYRVLYRAPVRAPLAVGDTVETAEQLDALPVGAVVASVHEAFGVGKRASFGWLWIEPPEDNADALPARVLELPGETS